MKRIKPKVEMKKIVFLFVLAALMSCGNKSDNNDKQKLSTQILSDINIQKVDSMARQLMKKGFYAGSGYQMVWARDLNTFIELSVEEYDNAIIRENILMFFHFQQENGELLDGYVPREAFTWGDPNPYDSPTALNHIGFKNTVETDQETSLIQIIYKYIVKTGDKAILDEIVAGKTVYARLVWSVEYLLAERFSDKYGLITGATTFDWGDVQVENGNVDTDEFTHWSIDVYDNAMFSIALENLSNMAANQEQQNKWGKLSTEIKNNIKKHLWDSDNNKFIPHLYTENSPFPEDFDENKIHYHGGTALAIEARVLNREEIAAALAHMKNNVALSGAPSIGLTVYPPYPKKVLGEVSGDLFDSYIYQNGGDWTWYGGRIIQQLIANGFIEEAYELSKPMMERVLENDGFYEWYTIDNKPSGSGDFKGSAGVLAKSIEMFYDWAHKNK